MDIFNNLSTGDLFLLLVALLVVVVLVFIIAKAPVGNNSVVVDINNAKTVERMAELIDGTMWHFTEPLGGLPYWPPFWYKFSFQNGKVTTWVANPSDGKWTVLDPVEYRIEELRYADTGKKFICVNWRVLDAGVLNDFMLIGSSNSNEVFIQIVTSEKKEYWFYAYLGDCNPWD